MTQSSTKIALVFGTRPQIIKCVPVIRECLRKNVALVLINTGQHYDFELSQIFFEGLNLPPPKFNLEVGSGQPGWQTGQIIAGVEKVLGELRPSVCLVPGDTNSAIGSALAAVKLKIPVAHLESGLRSFEAFMPEEINRKAIDHISQLLFAPTYTARNNLKSEAIPSRNIFLSGDTMYDLFLLERRRIANAALPIGLERQFVLATIHREENTENQQNLSQILDAIRQFSSPVILPLHPRTKNRLVQFNLFDLAKNISNLIITDPLDYHTMMKLMQSSQFVLTDSGGIQKEAFMASVPCITIRRNTEWIELVKLGVNILVPKVKKSAILNAMHQTIRNRNQLIRKIKNARNPYGDGKAARKVVRELVSRY